MQQLFYNRIEADYLNTLDIFWFRKKALLTRYYSPTSIVWTRGDNKSSISIEVNLVENLREYLLGQEVPKDGFVRLSYKTVDQSYDYKVSLTTTDCNYGRFRYWFNCPLCFRRVGVLYCRGNYFACRHCQYLTYESKNLSGRWKWAGKIISASEVDALREEVKREYYNGKMTRKFRQYLHKRHKFLIAYGRNIGHLQEMSLKPT